MSGFLGGGGARRRRIRALVVDYRGGNEMSGLQMMFRPSNGRDKVETTKREET